MSRFSYILRMHAPEPVAEAVGQSEYSGKENSTKNAGRLTLHIREPSGIFVFLAKDESQGTAFPAHLKAFEPGR